jgi:hypothetical protein
MGDLVVVPEYSKLLPSLIFPANRISAYLRLVSDHSNRVQMKNDPPLKQSVVPETSNNQE